MATIPTLEELQRIDTSHDLILSLTVGEEIIQFNKESERFTGFLRDEVLHKKISEVLIPTESAKQWKDLFQSIQHDLWIENFVLPIKTKDYQVHMITWTGFLVKNENGTIKDICIFGKPLKTEPIDKSSTIPFQPKPGKKEFDLHSNEQIPIFSPPTDSKPHRVIKEAPLKHGVNKIIFAREENILEERPPVTKSERQIPTVESKRTNIPSIAMEKPSETALKKLDSLNQSFTDLLRKYEIVTNRLEELEKQNRQVGKETLIAVQQAKQETTVPSTINKKTTTLEAKDVGQPAPEEREYTFFSDPFGFKRQHQELDLKKQRMEHRMKELEKFETRLMKEKDIFHGRVEEFSKWKEKLMALESAIEIRRQELIKQENLNLETPPHPRVMTKEGILPGMQDKNKTKGVVSCCTDETLDKISQSAAIIQRGILKQINTPFLDLLGYAVDEMVEKSYFDFIALEGLADVEKYYLDRLKGDSVSVYRTVFSTKENGKIPVEVSIKQTIYNGEKAEIAIITCIRSHDSTD